MSACPSSRWMSVQDGATHIGMTTRGATPAARASQRLLMGPWGHRVNTVSKMGEVDFGPQALIDLRGEELRWFDRWLKGSRGDTANRDEAPVRIFVMGTNEWRNEQEWPLGQVEAQVNCLKLQKRIVFGRANFDLLRLRVLSRV